MFAQYVYRYYEKYNFSFFQDHQQQTKTALLPPARATPAEIETSKAFKQFDIHQSSHHLYIGKIDLHLFDDSSNEGYTVFIFFTLIQF